VEFAHVAQKLANQSVKGGIFVGVHLWPVLPALLE